MKRKEKIRASLTALFQKVEAPNQTENIKESAITESAEMVTATKVTATENNVHTTLKIDARIEKKLDKIALIRNKEVSSIYEEALSFYLEFQLDIPEE